MSYGNETSITTAMANRRDVDAAVELYRKIKSDKSGKVVFLAGPPYSGRSDTLLAIGERLSREAPRPGILMGRCTDGRYFPLEVNYDKEAALIGETLALTAKVLAKVTPGVGELTDFAAQLLQTRLAGKPLMNDGSNRSYSPDEVKELIRRGAQAGPLVLLIDDLDQARDRWLLDLLRQMAPEIDRMRLMLAATLEGPSELGEYDDSEPEVITRVRGLMARGVAEWRAIHPLNQNEISAWLGRAQPGIIGTLHGITGGYPRRVFRLLGDWEERDVVHLSDPPGEWRWTSTQRPPLDIVKDVIYARLTRLFGPDDPDTIEEIRAWLAYGAMEGCVFTASAVAKAANCDVDELIDTIDDFLLWDREDNPDGLLLETEAVTVTGERRLWRYRFSDHFHWQALARDGFTREELVAAHSTLIRALREVYDPDTLYVAGALARLYREVGDKEMSRQFQRIADFRIPREQIREKALHLLAINKDGWNEWDLRQATSYLLEAVRVMMPLAPYEESLAVAEEAYRLAHSASAHHEMAIACLYCGALLSDLGDYLGAQGRYNKALDLIRQSGDRGIELSCFSGLGKTYQLQGRYAEAEPLCKRALSIVEKALGPEHPDTATGLDNLASLYDSQGRYAEAEPLSQRALAIREKALGPEHPDTATSLSNLAYHYESHGRYAEAEPLHQRSLAIREKALGPEHPDTAGSLNNLAYHYKSHGRSAEAEPLHQRALAIVEKALGPEHPDTATNLNNLASLYDSQGKYAEAEPLFQRALAIREKTLSPEHPDTATSLNNLAFLYRLQGRYAEAEPLYQRALAIMEKALGPEHPDTAASLNNLAFLYDSQGRYAEAKPLIHRALAIREKALGPEHTDTAASLNNLASFYRLQGGYAEAEPLIHRALAIREKALGPEHPDTAASLNNLAFLYRLQGRYAEAEPLYQRALAIMEKALGPEHPDTAASLNNLASLYDSQGRYAEAKPLIHRALAIWEKALGPEHPDTAASLNNLASLYDSQGRYAEAEPLYQRALAIWEKALGPEHPDTAASLNNLASLYRSQGRYAEAEPLYKRALAITEKALGPQHPKTITVLENYAELLRRMKRGDDASDPA